MRWVLWLLVGWLLVAAGGCTVMRAGGMYVVGMTQVPVPQGGRVKAVYVDGRVTPMVVVNVRSPLAKRETVAWYRETLARRGWVLGASRFEIYAQPQLWEGEWDSYHAYRIKKWGWNEIIKEELELRVWSDEGTVARVEVFGTYGWDYPSDVLVEGLGGDAIPMMLGGTLSNLEDGKGARRIVGAAMLPVVYPLMFVREAVRWLRWVV